MDLCLNTVVLEPHFIVHKAQHLFNRSAWHNVIIYKCTYHAELHSLQCVRAINISVTTANYYIYYGPLIND